MPQSSQLQVFKKQQKTTTTKLKEYKWSLSNREQLNCPFLWEGRGERRAHYQNNFNLIKRENEIFTLQQQQQQPLYCLEGMWQPNGLGHGQCLFTIIVISGGAIFLFHILPRGIEAAREESEQRGCMTRQTFFDGSPGEINKTYREAPNSQMALSDLAVGPLAIALLEQVK